MGPARTLIVALLFWSGSAVAEATTGIEFEARCTVKVEGKTYLQNRKCRVDFWPNIAGPLTSGEAANGIVACVECDQKAICKCSWGDGPLGKADRALGPVEPGKVECWASGQARICFREMKLNQQKLVIKTENPSAISMSIALFR